MERLALLKELSFGSRVAEEETQHLASYFVETYQWSRIERGEIDIIIGEKGTGKSAIYTLLTAKTDVFFDKNILLVAAETPRGNTVFKDLVANPPTSEHEFIVLWKLYILALAAERLRDLGFSDKNAQKLCDTLEDAGLLPKEFDIRAILRSVYGAAKRLLSAEALEITGTVDPNTSFPIATGKITLREPIDDRSRIGFISVDGLLRAANNSLSQMGYKLWVLFDRLDVAFAETLDLEANALRALIRVYADIRGLDFIGLKIFLGEDIWKRVNEGGFRESSHLTRVDTLRWTNEYLLNLIVRRILINDVLVKEFDIDREAIMRDNDEKISLIKK